MLAGTLTQAINHSLKQGNQNLS